MCGLVPILNVCSLVPILNVCGLVPILNVCGLIPILNVCVSLVIKHMCKQCTRDSFSPSCLETRLSQLLLPRNGTVLHAISPLLQWQSSQLVGASDQRSETPRFQSWLDSMFLY